MALGPYELLAVLAHKCLSALMNYISSDRGFKVATIILVLCQDDGSLNRKMYNLRLIRFKEFLYLYDHRR